MSLKLIVGSVIIVIVVVGVFAYTSTRIDYDRICPWNSKKDCKFAISNIVPICENIKVVEEWKQQYPAATKPFGYTIRKFQPDEMNQEISRDRSGYDKLLGIRHTEDIWWFVDYPFVEAGTEVIPEHPRLTIYINEKTKDCTPRKRFQ